MKNGTLTVSGGDECRSEYDKSYCVTVNDNSTKDKRDEANLKIIRFLYGVGIPITSVAFHYFYTAIQICLHNPLAPTNAQKNIYMVISEHYNVSYKSVERAMRVAFSEDVSARATGLFEKELRILAFNKCDELTPIEFISLIALVVSI